MKNSEIERVLAARRTSKVLGDPQQPAPQEAESGVDDRVLIDRMLPPLGPLPHLLILSGAGAAIYGAWLWLFARATGEDAIGMIRR